MYLNLPSAIRPIPHSAALPIPIPLPCLPNLKGESSENSENSSCDSDDTIQLNQRASQSHLISQEDLNNLVRDLNLMTKSKSELLASRLQHWSFLAPHTKVTLYRQKSLDLISYFPSDGKLCYCNDVSALFQSIGVILDQTN